MLGPAATRSKVRGLLPGDSKYRKLVAGLGWSLIKWWTLIFGQHPAFL
jgi:hypothetical protein